MKFSIEGTSGAAVNSVTRLSDLLDFGQLFKAFGQQLICPNLPHSNEIFVKVSKSIIFQVNSFLGNFYRHLAIFSGHTGSQPTNTHMGPVQKMCHSVLHRSHPLHSAFLPLVVGVIKMSIQKWHLLMGSGCGLAGRAIASNSRGPKFESKHRQNIYWTFFTVNCIERTKIKIKEAVNGQLFLKKWHVHCRMLWTMPGKLGAWIPRWFSLNRHFFLKNGPTPTSF